MKFQLQPLLLREFVDLSSEDRDKVMRHFEGGCDHILYLAEVQFSVWQRLPLRACALGHPVQSLAREILRAGRTQFQALEPDMQAEQHGLIISMFV